MFHFNSSSQLFISTSHLNSPFLLPVSILYLNSSSQLPIANLYICFSMHFSVSIPHNQNQSARFQAFRGLCLRHQSISIGQASAPLIEWMCKRLRSALRLMTFWMNRLIKYWSKRTRTFCGIDAWCRKERNSATNKDKWQKTNAWKSEGLSFLITHQERAEGKLHHVITSCLPDSPIGLSAWINFWLAKIEKMFSKQKKERVSCYYDFDCCRPIPKDKSTPQYDTNHSAF